MSWFRFSALALALAALPFGPAVAGGFAVSEHDGAATGRSGTAIAHSAPSAVHYNPAALSLLFGPRATAGVTAIAPSAVAHEPAGTGSTSAHGGLRTPPHAYAAYGFDRVSVGVGFNAPFGGGLRWPDEWRGRYELVEMKLEVLAGHLAAAYRIDDRWSVGAALTLYRVNVLLDRRIDFVDRDGSALLGGGGVGLGGGLGLQFRPEPWATLGLNARLPTPMALKGNAHFSNVPESFNEVLVDQPISTHLALPAKIGLGAKLDLSAVRLLVDAEYTFWSSFRSFEVDFSDERTPDVKQPRDWQDAPTFRVGVERDFGNTVARAGALFDGAASPASTLSPSLPDSSRLGLSLGAGHDFGIWRADAAWQLVTFLPRASEGEAFPARYAAWAHLFALSLSWEG